MKICIRNVDCENLECYPELLQYLGAIQENDNGLYYVIADIHSLEELQKIMNITKQDLIILDESYIRTDAGMEIVVKDNYWE